MSIERKADMGAAVDRVLETAAPSEDIPVESEHELWVRLPFRPRHYIRVRSQSALQRDWGMFVEATREILLNEYPLLACSSCAVRGTAHFAIYHEIRRGVLIGFGEWCHPQGWSEGAGWEWDEAEHDATMFGFGQHAAMMATEDMGDNHYVIVASTETLAGGPGLEVTVHQPWYGTSDELARIERHRSSIRSRAARIANALAGVWAPEHCECGGEIETASWRDGFHESHGGELVWTTGLRSMVLMCSNADKGYCCPATRATT